MADSRTIGELGNIIKDIKLGNSFLFVGIFTILIYFYCYACEQNPSEPFNSLALQFGLITLIFGGVFRLANIITRPFKYIKIFNKEDNEIFISSRTEKAKELLNYLRKEETPLEAIIFKWNDIFRFSIWTSLLFVYLFWINYYVEIVPSIIIKIIFVIFIFDVYMIFVSAYKMKNMKKFLEIFNSL